MRLLKICIFMGLAILFFACQNAEPVIEKTSNGKLFIIGGGKRPPELVTELIKTSGMDSAGYAMILPMPSAEPDTAAFYAIKQFTDQQLSPDRFMKFPFPEFSVQALDSLKKARLIYITGGSQVRFMDTIAGLGITEAIREAFNNGATIAGTSAGAAVMSQMMITGDEKKHPEYTGNFRTIEAENLIVKPGLGLLEKSIIDQHFIYRMRMNRLVTVVLEYPEQMGIGIDESTAIVVEDNKARVVGDWQVIVLRNTQRKNKIQNGLLGGAGMELSVYLPGDSFELDNN
jgi:cyanophycinase